MPRLLPPLNALRAFEAAARHQSFVRAADELRVTPGAVSHQVKGLEQAMGAPLFRRLARGLRLTESGRALLPGLAEGFDRLDRAVAEARGRRLSGRLVVGTLASFAAGWLVPRLPRFRARCPEIDVELRTGAGLVDFGREDVDLVIRYGAAPSPGLAATFLLREEVFPVCAPALLEEAGPLRRLEDLRHHVLLHDVDAEPHQPWMSWPAWLAGTPAVAATRGPRFSDSQVLMAAAAAGLGVALGRGAIVGDQLKAGRLVRPLPGSRTAGWAYRVACPPARLEDAKVAAFLDWVVAEAGE